MLVLDPGKRLNPFLQEPAASLLFVLVHRLAVQTLVLAQGRGVGTNTCGWGSDMTASFGKQLLEELTPPSLYLSPLSTAL